MVFFMTTKWPDAKGVGIVFLDRGTMEIVDTEDLPLVNRAVTVRRRRRPKRPRREPPSDSSGEDTNDAEEHSHEHSDSSDAS